MWWWPKIVTQGDRAISQRRARFWSILIWTVIVLFVLLIVWYFLGAPAESEKIGNLKTGR